MRIARFILPGAAAVLGLIYICDDLYARVRNVPAADVHIDRYLQIPQKFNRLEYEPTDPIVERCIYTLLPHFGHKPCWYMMRHRVRFVSPG